MKHLLIVLALFTSTNAVFAQKEKQKTKTESTSKTNQATYSCPMHPDEVSNKPGKCAKCGMDLTRSKKEQMKMEVMKTYTCPMHADVTSNQPGDCPKCGMKLVEKTTDNKGKKKGSSR